MSSSSYLLKTQARSMVAHVGDDGSHGFLVGTASLKGPNDVRLLRYAEDDDEIACVAGASQRGGWATPGGGASRQHTPAPARQPRNIVMPLRDRSLPLLTPAYHTSPQRTATRVRWCPWRRAPWTPRCW
jgi:hypothetical protein